MLTFLWCDVGFHLVLAKIIFPLVSCYSSLCFQLSIFSFVHFSSFVSIISAHFLSPIFFIVEVVIVYLSSTSSLTIFTELLSIYPTSVYLLSAIYLSIYCLLPTTIQWRCFFLFCSSSHSAFICISSSAHWAHCLSFSPAAHFWARPSSARLLIHLPVHKELWCNWIWAVLSWVHQVWWRMCCPGCISS